jgi:hypothetical protein
VLATETFVWFNQYETHVCLFVRGSQKQQYKHLDHQWTMQYKLTNESKKESGPVFQGSAVTPRGIF